MLPFCNRLGDSIAKKRRRVPEVTGPSERPTVILTEPKRGLGPHYHAEAAVNWCSFAHAYCGSPVDIEDFLILKECIQATRSLRCNENIHMTKRDKDSNVVITNKSDCVSKMHFILQDSFKFENLGPTFETENTAKIEAHVQRQLLQLKTEGLLPFKIYNRIRATCLQRPRM